MSNLSASQVIEGSLADEVLLLPVRDEWAQLGIDAEISYSPANPNPSLRIDCDGAQAIGRLTWWADGSMVAEVLRLSDHAALMNQSGMAATDAEALATLRKVGSAVGGQIAF